MSEVPLYPSTEKTADLPAPCVAQGELERYRGTSLIRNNPLLGPYIRTMPRALWWP